MKKQLLIIGALAILSGCATIISGTDDKVTITSSPNKASFYITNEDGNTVYSGVTPAKVELDRGSGYFDGETYTVRFEEEGYTPAVTVIDSSLNAWYFGNLLFGGLIGGLIVDPISGAMWDLPTASMGVLHQR